jgi:hypothetical protein
VRCRAEGEPIIDRWIWRGSPLTNYLPRKKGGRTLGCERHTPMSGLKSPTRAPPIDAGFWPGLGAGGATVIVFNRTAVASNPAAGPGVVTTDDAHRRKRGGGIALAADASVRFEPFETGRLWHVALTACSTGA